MNEGRKEGRKEGRNEFTVLARHHLENFAF